jgi:hypothetical protein
MRPVVYPMVIRLGSAAARVWAAASAAERSSALARGRKNSPASVSWLPCGGAVDQAGAHLLFEVADLPAQGPRAANCDKWRDAHRWIIEPAITPLHLFRRLRIRREIRDGIHQVFLTLAAPRPPEGSSTP